MEVLAQASPAAQVIATVNDATTFQEYRMGILERDHPDMRAGPMSQGAQLIAGGLNDLATQSRLAREADENRRLQEKNTRRLKTYSLQGCKISCDGAKPLPKPSFRKSTRS
jgi:hypothetical protein